MLTLHVYYGQNFALDWAIDVKLGTCVSVPHSWAESCA